MKKISDEQRLEFLKTLPKDSMQLVSKCLKLLFIEDNTLYFSLCSQEDQKDKIRAIWKQIKEGMDLVFEIKEVKFIDATLVDELFLSKLIDICNAKKVELIHHLNKAS